MRLSKDEITLLKNEVKKLSDEASVYLFGSRTDDTKRGGDIDILIVSDKLTKRDIRKIRVEFFKKFEEQKLDIVLDTKNLLNPFSKLVIKKAVKL